MGAFSAYTGSLELTQFLQVFTGFEMFDTYKKAYTGKVEPITITLYKQILIDFRDLEMNDFATSPMNQNYLPTVTKLNADLACTNDLWVLRDSDCNGTNKWKLGDSYKKDNDATPLCLNINTFSKMSGHS
jgi:hypothetical protein